MRLAISRYPLDPIIAGVAIFEPKQRTGSLPDGVDYRDCAPGGPLTGGPEHPVIAVVIK